MEQERGYIKNFHWRAKIEISWDCCETELRSETNKDLFTDSAIYIHEIAQVYEIEQLSILRLTTVTEQTHFYTYILYIIHIY